MGEPRYKCLECGSSVIVYDSTQAGGRRRWLCASYFCGWQETNKDMPEWVVEPIWDVKIIASWGDHTWDKEGGGDKDKSPE